MCTETVSTFKIQVKVNNIEASNIKKEVCMRVMCLWTKAVEISGYSLQMGKSVCDPMNNSQDKAMVTNPKLISILKHAFICTV